MRAAALLLILAACAGRSPASEPARADEPTLHTSEIGYETFGPKRAFVEAEASARGLPEGSKYLIRRADGSLVASGVPAAKQTRWGRDFWPIDFSQITSAGRYQVIVSLGPRALASSLFSIGDTPLLDADMFQVAVHQLDERYPSPMAATAPYFGGYLPANRTARDDVVYSNSPDTKTYPYREPRDGDYVPRIWRDCSSNYTEVESAGVTILALIDLYAKVASSTKRFDAAQTADLVLNLQRGVDYFVSLQESHPGDPLRDGRLRHSIMVNVFDGAWWAGNVHVWHDTAFGALILARGSAALAEVAAVTRDPAAKESLTRSAAAALRAAKRAWKNADFRPYYLAEDLDTKSIPGYDYQGDLWPWTSWRRLARAMYGVADAGWDMGALEVRTSGYAGLRSRELIAFLDASTALYRVSDERAPEKAKYLDTAKRIAAELMHRQYGAVDAPIDGVVGMFHEFSSDSGPARDAFLLESAQAGMSLLGHYDFTSLSGFIDLLTLAPDDADAARWHRAVALWSTGYERAAAERNPLGIAPATVYASTVGEHGAAAVYWFGNHLHGGNEIPGQAAHSLLEAGNYLNDVSFYPMAVNDVQFYAGVNAGIGTGHQPSSFIKGVGARTLVGPYMEGSAPAGSVANGYHATNSFSPDFYKTYDDDKTIRPDGFGDGATSGQESWILHSHSYVLGAVSVEAPFRLTVAARSAGAALPGLKVRVEYPSNRALPAQSFVTASDGSATIDSAKLGQAAQVRLLRRGYPDYVVPVATVGGGSLVWSVDYRDYFGISVAGLPARLEPRREYPVTVSVEDLGDIEAPVRLELRYAGLSSPSGSALLEGRDKSARGANRVRRLRLVATSLDASQAYVLRVHATSGSNSRVVNVTGTIGE
jgi:hypothetical protein